jgi:hypothetical protein
MKPGKEENKRETKEKQDEESGTGRKNVMKSE